MNCRRLTWNPNYKGFDDWQLALRRENQRRKEIDRLSFKAQYLRGLCELAHIEDCIELWQHLAENKTCLTEYLGLTREEHETFLRQGRDALGTLLEPQRRKQRFVLYQLNWTSKKRSHLLSRNLRRCKRPAMNSRPPPCTAWPGLAKSTARWNRATQRF